MKILVVSRLPLGGIRTYMRYVYANMDNAVEITVVASPVQEVDALKEDVQAYGGRLVISDDNPLGLAKAVRRELMSGDYDILHSHGFTSGAYAYLASTLYSIPHILTIHGIVEERLLKGWGGGVKRRVLHWVVSHVDVLHGVGHDIMNHVIHEMPALAQAGTQCVVIQNGVDTQWFASYNSENSSLRQDLGINDDTYVFGFMGRLMPQKGFDLLLGAVELLAQESTPVGFSVICCGSGDYKKEYIQEVFSRGLDGYFHFVPFRKDPRDVLAAVDAVVMPSRWEAFPLLPAEAMSSGKPVLASRCIGLRECIEGTPALAFAPEDVVGLKKAMVSVLDHSLDLVFKKYQKEAIARYCIKKTASRLEELYKKLVTEAGRS